MLSSYKSKVISGEPEPSGEPHRNPRNQKKGIQKRIPPEITL